MHLTESTNHLVLAVCVVCWLRGNHCCPVPNGLHQLLPGNSALRSLYQRFAKCPNAMSLDELRKVVTELHLLTLCQPLARQTPHREDSQVELDAEEALRNSRRDPEDEETLQSRGERGHGTLNENTDLGTKSCETVETVIMSMSEVMNGSADVVPRAFLDMCPFILNSLLEPPCAAHLGARPSSHDKIVSDDGQHGHHDHHRHVKDGESYMTKDSWIGAVVSLVLIGLIAVSCIMVIPVLKSSKYYVSINHFLLALAIGTLAGDALIHLLPHALTMEKSSHLAQATYGFTAFLGILLFLLLERTHNMIGHKHSHGHTAHEFADGDMSKEFGSELSEIPNHNSERLVKMSQLATRSSLVFADSSSPSEQKCFESCPPNVGVGAICEDANGNSGVNALCKSSRNPERNSSVMECERLVSASGDHQVVSTRVSSIAIPPPPLIQNSKSMVRQDSKNFNMVLQEYHIGHHGHSHHGHSHVTGKKGSLRTMILLGDGMHTFMDGMAIGAAFGTTLTGGIATAIAVLCHELPHKVGDFAILFEMGMKKNQAVKMVAVLWLLSLVGLAIGVSIGSIHSISPWIYSFTAGVFLYLALVDLLSELSTNAEGRCGVASQLALQVAGMLTGSLIMLVIAIYEHDLETLLEEVL